MASILSLPSHASGISIIITCGNDLPLINKSSIMLSRQAESDCPDETMGNNISISSFEKLGVLKPFSPARSQFKFPCRVLISPLCAMYLKGCANFQEGKVLVANLECTSPNADTTRLSFKSLK